LFEKPETIACLTFGVAVAVFAAQSLPLAQTARESVIGQRFSCGWFDVQQYQKPNGLAAKCAAEKFAFIDLIKHRML
jgi:hypothetical protein